mmetsp:Transcript_21284/g.37841  ORF Transcript_21284/g.37841 Transcript_21284/m.37841 type:complete len:222 (+) Transcript_21284:204-869(+)
MGALFGRKRKREEPQNKISDKDKAILDLKRQKVRMKKYKIKINSTLEKEIKLAKHFIKLKNKKKALFVLKKKKYLERLVEQTDNGLLNLEKLVDSIEYASMQKQIYDAMKAGNECLSKIQQEISIEDVEQLMEDTEEAIAYQEQVSDILAGSLSTDDVEDVEAELQLLEKQDAEFRALELEDQMPEAPESKVVEDNKQVETESVKPAAAETKQKQRVAALA